MNKKRAAVVLTFIAVIGLLIGFIILHGKSVDEGEVTRYEWMEMLCEQEGLTEYKNQAPYFSDVDENSFYFPYLQSAVEWAVLDAAADFDGEKYVSGRFAALTAMKTIGQSKLQIYLDTEEEITDDVYIELAVTHGLIEEKQLAEGLSAEECELVLEVLKNIYFSEFWRDDYANVTYQSGVAELSPEDILQCNADCSEIVIADDVGSSLEPGTIIVFEEKNTKLKIARKIAGISSDGTVLLSSAELDEVAESITVSDITELTFENIVNYHALRESANAVNSSEYRRTGANISKAAIFSADVNSKGYKLSLSTEGKGEERHLEVQVTDNAAGVSVTLPVSGKIEADSEYSVEIDIDKICIGAQVSYSIRDGLKYAEAAVDAHASFSGAVKASKDVKILLCKTPVPLGNGIIGADIQIYLVLSAEGSISFEAELPVGVSVYYEKDRGLRNLKQNILPENPTIEANCDMGAMLRLEPTLVVLGCFNVIDVEADMGVTASAKVTTRPNSQICADISVSFPVITLSVCGDDDADTIVGKMGLSAEWKIISSEEAPVQFGIHYEMLPDKTVQFTEKCTYDESVASNGESVDADKDATVSNDESAASGNQDSLEMKNTYHTRYGEINKVDSPNFCFDYPDNWTVTKEETNINRMFGEEVVITNDRGVTVTYTKFDSRLGNEGRSMISYKGVKVADVGFKPSCPPGTDSDYSYLGNFAVAKVKATGSLNMDTDSDFTEFNGRVFYVVLPESEIEQNGGSFVSVGMLGFYNEFSFDYPGPYMLIAEAPDGQFTEEEEQEVIAILSSFRVADDGTSAAEENGGAWEEDSILTELQEGDFSYFAGTYRPCGVYRDWYGGGEDIADLILREDGVIVGGGFWYYPDPYPETEPIWVTKNEDGSYRCQVTAPGIEDGIVVSQNYFLIYPEGVIGENPYIYNDPTLTKTVYIQYMSQDNGVVDIIYLKVEEE